jgi:hypothetical protein
MYDYDQHQEGPNTKESFWAELDKDDMHDVIEKLQQKPLTGVSKLYAEGYGSALDDLYYAGTLSISAVKQHIDHWQGHLATNAEEYGYCNGLNDVLDLLTEIVKEHM